MEVKWTMLAKDALRDTAAYIRREYGQQIRQKFMLDVKHTNKLIGGNPNIGKKEPALSNRTIEYRSIVVNRLNKIVYYVDNECVQVADFWDCRRNPETLAQRIK
jgi:plasmid stabilization system protein ParE